ncbi:pyruvate kinase [Clostridium polynesiense]|uniref:pyruvate kinase n=1 Tax=Clostridium polynesiense TaxID=1325933 RepID=UPI0005912CFF|nr:pyruvate kinase [Clostridium polynesiense]
MEVICSVGPNVKTTEDLKILAENGMTAARFNFAHLQEEDYDFTASLIKYLRENYAWIKIIQDIQGSKLRISNKYPKEFLAYKGQEVYFCTESYYTAKRALAEEFNIIPIIYNGSRFDFKNVSRILIKDRTMEFEIINSSDDFQVIKTAVRRGGIIRGEKGVNAVGFNRESAKLSLKDKKDIIFGLENYVDVLCLSYTTSTNNIIELKEYISQVNKYIKSDKLPKIWGKIECINGINNLKEIVKICNGIMIGRGDLFAEADLLDLPVYEERIMECMKTTTKPLIIATYLLDTMKNSTIPSLPEINEIYRFIKKRADGFMLAGEVSSGKYPREALKFLVNMIEKYSAK